MEFYKHCLLKKDNRYQVTWLPEKYAKPGKSLKLRRKIATEPKTLLTRNSEWEDGWICITSGSRLPYKHLYERAHLTQREVSDI